MYFLKEVLIVFKNQKSVSDLQITYQLWDPVNDVTNCHL